jgi:hypothetical protein
VTPISGVPDELHGYTAATAHTHLLLSSAAAVALAGIKAFNDANVASDMPGTITDVATPVDLEADMLLAHDRIPAAFADALVALDADGLADTVGRYQIDEQYAAFVASLVQARVDDPNGTDEEVFDAALLAFDAGFAETFADVAAQDPSASTADIWEAAIGEQARRDADLLDLYVSGDAGSDGTGQGYAELADLLDSIESRSGALGGYAEQLYVHQLGAEGVIEFLDYIDTLAALDALDGTIDGPDIRTDLLIPFSTSFAVAAASPHAAPMIETLTDLEYDEQAARRVAMLLSGATQPTEFLVPAVNALLVESPPADLIGGEYTVADEGQNGLIFGPDGPDDIRVLAVEALGANPEASEQFAAMGKDQVQSLIFGADGVGYTGDEDYVRFVEAASNALEHAIITEGALGTDGERTRTDEILIDIIQVAGTVEDGKTEVNDVVPDPLRVELAALSALSMGRIEDFVVAGGPLEADVQAYFAELSLNDSAVETLTLGAMNEFAHDAAEAIEIYSGYGDGPITLDGELRNGLEGAEDLMGTLSSAFNEAIVDPAEQDAAVIAALHWIADGAAGVGLATSPLTGGSGALAGLGVGALIDLGFTVFDSANEPPPDDSVEFIDDVEAATEAILTRMLYESPDMRAALVAQMPDPATLPDPATMSYEEFAALNTVDTAANTDEESVMIDILYNYFRFGRLSE